MAINKASILLVDDYHGQHCINQLINRYGDNLFLAGIDSIGYCSFNEKRDCKASIAEAIDNRELFLRVDKKCNELWRVERHSTSGFVIAESSNELSRVEWQDGALWAINEKAEWCDACERYEIPPSENVTVYQVSEHYLTAIINGDYSGLSDIEEENLNQWIGAETQGIGNYCWACVPEHRHEFVMCEITGETSHCVELHLINMGE